MRTSDTKRVTHRPSVEELRSLVDERLERLGKGKRAAALRAVNMPTSSFERILREGLSERSPRAHEKALTLMGVLDLIPRS